MTSWSSLIPSRLKTPPRNPDFVVDLWILRFHVFWGGCLCVCVCRFVTNWCVPENTVSPYPLAYHRVPSCSLMKSSFLGYTILPDTPNLPKNWFWPTSKHKSNSWTDHGTPEKRGPGQLVPFNTKNVFDHPESRSTGLWKKLQSLGHRKLTCGE